MAGPPYSSPNGNKTHFSGPVPALLQRLHKLGHIDLYADSGGKQFKQIVQRYVKASSALLGGQVETVFDDTLNCLAEMMMIERSLPGVFPGINAILPFLRPHPVGKQSGLTPWPARRHFYVAEDFAEVREMLSAEPLDVSDPKGKGFLDYLSLGETSGEVRSDVSFSELRDRFQGEDLPVGADGRKTELRFADLGTRLITGYEEVRLLQILIPVDETTDAMLTCLARQMGVPVSGSVYKLAHFTSLRTANAPGGGCTSEAFVLVDSTGVMDASIGWDQKDSGHPLLTDEQNAIGAWASKRLFKPLSIRALLQMGLPAYFDYQLDAVEDDVLDGAGRQLVADVGDLGRGSRRSPPASRRPKMFKIIRALRSPRRDLLPQSADTMDREAQNRVRQEPDAQVSVRGFWRRLDEGTVGKGPDDLPVIGRTWISPHIRWRDKPPSRDLPLVKEPLLPHLTDPRRKGSALRED